MTEYKQPYKIIGSTICDLKPTTKGGIINVDNREVLFKGNSVYNITSSTTAACFYITNSTLNIDNSCFSRCTGNGGNDAFGNIGDIQNTIAVITRISAFQCSYSESYNADSVLRFHECGAVIRHYNSSFCYGRYGASTFRSQSNISDFDISYMTCSSGIDYAFIECRNTAKYVRCIFINSTKIKNCMICSIKGSIFDTCYFFQMTTTKTRFEFQVTLINCCSDEDISGYSLTVYSKTNAIMLPFIRKPNCMIKSKRTYKRYIKNNTKNLFIIILLVC